MTLYIDTKVEFLDVDAVSTIGCWHLSEPLFAVASYSQERGGSVTIFSDTGEPLRDVTYPVHQTSQASALAWHPERVLLATGWENGDLHVWFAGHREFASVNGPHKAPIVLLEFSEKGGRMVTADSMGLLTGWRCDGQYQFLTMFSHDLRDMLMHITFRRTIESEVREEIANLAKAAVAGDENALDTLTNWRPRTAARNLTHAVVKDNHCFFVGTQTGMLYYINQGGSCTEVLNANASAVIMQMLWHPKKDAVICFMSDMTVTLFLVESTGILTELERVKLTGRCGAIAWAGNSLAILTGEFSVRIWDIEKSDNFLLKTELKSTMGGHTANNERNTPNITYVSQDSTESSSALNALYANSRKPHKMHMPTNELFTCLAYSGSNHTLCAGTNQGNLFIWKRSPSYLFNAPEEAWQLTNIATVRGAIKHCAWGFNELAKACIMVNCISNVYIMKEQVLLTHYTRDLWAVQRNAKTIYMEHCSGRHCLVQAELTITAITLNNANLVISNGRSISTYNIEKISKNDEMLDEVESNTTSASITTTGNSNSKEQTLKVKLLQTFLAECLALCIQNQNIFCLNALDVIIYSIGGVILNKIQTSDHEGKIIGMDLTDGYLSLFTMNGFLKAYDVTRHDPKLLFPSKSGYDLFENFGEFIMAKCNSIGSHMAMVIANKNFAPMPTLYCWNFERDQLMSYSLSDDKSSSLPVSLYWDTDEPRLLALELKSVLPQPTKADSQQKNTSSETKSAGVHSVESQVFVIFYSEQGVLNVLEKSTLCTTEQLINLCVPNVVLLDINAVKRKPLQDFIDLKDCDVNTRKLVLNFSLHVAEGNMDLAYRCIRSIQSKAIWTNLAKMCVKTMRLDVAKVCLGHLEMARSVRAVREAMSSDDLEKEAKIAVLAIELGMIDKAKELYVQCGRYDLLNKLLQSCGQMDEALQVAETHDRVHLKHTYFKKAEQLRDSGDIKGALEFYEKTQNPVQNITQLLLDNPTALQRYMQSTTDTNMLKWWGQYIESSGDMDAALAVYQKAEDCFSQVKILCYLGKISKADVIARQSGDRAACYHLARHYENIGKFQEAIMFYTRAQTFSNAIRICKENDFQDELWTVACSARSRDKAIAAAYFEECGSHKRAVELYHRAGMLHKALEMAFESEQPEILEIIASELTPESDAELVNRCADFFISIEQHQKAVQMLARTKHLKRAIDICLERGMPITEDLAELLTPLKGEHEEEVRIGILTQLGELLQQQGDYHTATKKFTQAGDKVRGMKSLLKSGNTEKIIFFANMSRQREVYIMAANYLQALNWQDDANILKQIVTFYSKGQAYDSLANFYAICAQIEIDDYHDYEKALKAMHEAAKCLEKLQHAQQALNNLQRTIGDVKDILSMQQSLKQGDTQTVIAGCRNILMKPELPPIRHTHILALLIKAFAYSKQYNDAARALKELAMKNNFWSSSGLLEKSLVQKIANECNLDFDIIWNSGRQTREQRPHTGDLQDDEEEIQEVLR